MRKDDFLTRFCSPCLKLCIFKLLLLIFIFYSTNKIEVHFFPSHPLKYFLGSFGSYTLEVKLSAWMCNSLPCTTEQSEFKLTFQFWSFLHLESSSCIIFLVRSLVWPAAITDRHKGQNSQGLIFHLPAPCDTTRSCANCHHCPSAAVSHTFCTGMTGYRGYKLVENSPCVLCSILTKARTSALMVC